MEKNVGRGKIGLVRGDITKVPVDAMVNAANSELIGGGGVDGAIHRAGGPEIMVELNRIRPAAGCPTGSAVVTGAGNLPAKYVIHAVGPVWREGRFQEALDLESAYAVSLELAAGKGAARISFPSISTGVYRFPVDQAASVALGTVAKYLRGKSSPVREVIFVLFDESTLKAYETALAAL